jgi:L-lysine 2,3-aminomutase
MATEESAKRIARDIEIYRKRDNIKEIEISGGDPGAGNVQRGTKDLMRMIREGIDAAETDIEDVEITE